MEHKLNGFMTVEAALLMPMAWFALFFLIFAGIFQYDRCIAEQDGRRIVLRASQMRGKDEAAVTQSVLAKGELAGESKMLFGSDLQRDLELTNNRVKMTIKGKVNTILNSLVRAEDVPVFAYGTEYETKKYDPVLAIRTCRRIEHYAGN